MSGDFDTTEVHRLAADLRSSPGRVGAGVASATRAAAARVEVSAKRAAPVRTGNLRNSIGRDITGDGRNGSITAIIGPTADYGGYVELGTSRMRPRPYLFPALDAVAPSWLDALGQATGGILD